MGICVSCDAADEGAATARVVLPSGELREYAPPATAAMALEEAGGQGSWFLCDADGMVFEGPIRRRGGGPRRGAPAGADLLRPPRRDAAPPPHPRRGRRARRQGELGARQGRRRGGRRTAVLPMPPAPARRRGGAARLPRPRGGVRAAEPVSPVAAKPVQKRRVACRGGRASRFSPDLTAIPEIE
ncbi:hypothetical protein HU200_010839 [Digitaria exilis]|uniref:Uncharacterized protein n=1 Tax=Digitaria exilis TaxID=1010633 RepID=A0A835KLW7_9POAL|nr:hypothetical protein HU200_010839 [Digitaria exilis]